MTLGRKSDFRTYLRTGYRPGVTRDSALLLKFNPYHDPDDGRFTFAPGGGTNASSEPDIVVTGRRRSRQRLAPTLDPNHLARCFPIMSTARTSTAKWHAPSIGSLAIPMPRKDQAW